MNLLRGSWMPPNTNLNELIEAFWKSEKHYYKNKVKSFRYVREKKSVKNYFINFLINVVSLVITKRDLQWRLLVQQWNRGNFQKLTYLNEEYGFLNKMSYWIHHFYFIQLKSALFSILIPNTLTDFYFLNFQNKRKKDMWPIKKYQNLT